MPTSEVDRIGDAFMNRERRTELLGTDNQTGDEFTRTTVTSRDDVRVVVEAKSGGSLFEPAEYRTLSDVTVPRK